MLRFFRQFILIAGLVFSSTTYSTCGCPGCPGTTTGSSLLCLPTQITRTFFGLLTSAGFIESRMLNRYDAEFVTFSIGGVMALSGVFLAKPWLLYYAGSTALSGATSLAAKLLFPDADVWAIDLSLFMITGATWKALPLPSVVNASDKAMRCFDFFKTYISTTTTISGTKLGTSVLTKIWDLLTGTEEERLPSHHPSSSPIRQGASSHWCAKEEVFFLR